MSARVAALPMYDWPEAHAQTDRAWAKLRDRLRALGVSAPERLARRNADLPPVPGGIRDRQGRVIAPDPATLPPDGLDLPALWRHPLLLVGQTCWGPMEQGLAEDAAVVGQGDYSGIEGGDGAFYSSAILMRAAPNGRPDASWPAPEDAETGAPGRSGNMAPTGFPGFALPGSGVARDKARRKPDLSAPIGKLRGARFAFNGTDSMSGFLALSRDLEDRGESFALFAGLVETGAHRASIIAVAEGRADACAVDCRTWALAKRFEPQAAALRVVGWTAKRLGLPFITSRRTEPKVRELLRETLNGFGG